MMLRRKARPLWALVGSFALSCAAGAAPARAAGDGGLHLCRISRPSGVVAIVELYGYEIDDVRRRLKDDYREAQAEWVDGSEAWAVVRADEEYPVARPVEPDLQVLADVTGKSDEERAAIRDEARDALEVWNVSRVTDAGGNTSARAIREDYMRRAERREMARYARAVLAHAEAREQAGNPPPKPVVETLQANLASADAARERADAINRQLAAQREADGLEPPEPNPPTLVKAELVEWPGLVTIYHGHNWHGDEKFVTAVKEAGYGAAGCAAWQIEHVTKRGLKAFVFLWEHEAGPGPAEHRENDGILAYYLGDRIPPNRWGHWAALEAAAYAGDPYHPVVFSMAPRAWGGIEHYFPVVRGRAVCYYHYHWDGNRAPHRHFTFLEQYRRVAAEHGGVPVMRLLETRAEDIRKTRHTVFTSLAYGVRGFQFGGGIFDVNDRDERGVPKPNALGEAVTNINRAIKAFSPVFKRARNIDVFQTPPLPESAKEAPEDYWVRPSGQHVVMGEFADRNDRFLLLANRDAFNAHEATLHFAEEGLSVSLMDKETGDWRSLALRPQDGRFSVAIPMEEAGAELVRVADPGGP